MRVSNSQIQTFKRCPRLWELQYKYCLKPVKTAEALETGATYHDKVEQIVKSGQFEPDGDPKTDAMAQAFCDKIAPQIAGRFEPEVWFEYQTKGGNTVVGRYDGISKDAVLEHKTTSAKVDGDYWSGVSDDEQLLTYMMASGTNKAVYTACQKPTIRQTQKETPEQYADRCRAWYDVDSDQKINMTEVIHTQEEIEQHERDIDAMCETIQSCKNFYRNRGWCKVWGRMCDYAPVCNHYDPEQIYPDFEVVERD